MRRAAVHDRRLTGSNVHIYVVNAESSQCRQDMLDRLDLKPITTDGGAELGSHEMLDRGCERGSVFAVSVYEDYAGIYRGRPERESNWLSGMEPNPRTTHRIC